MLRPTSLLLLTFFAACTTLPASKPAPSIMQVHDIRDLLPPDPPSSSPASFNLSESPNPPRPQRSSEAQEKIAEITALIQSTIDPPSWQNPKTASLRELNGQLIINQSPANHIAITHLLTQLRENQSLHLNCTARALIIDNKDIPALNLSLPPSNPQYPSPISARILDPQSTHSLLQQTQKIKSAGIVSHPLISLQNGQSTRLTETFTSPFISAWRPGPNNTYLPIHQNTTSTTSLQLTLIAAPNRTSVLLKGLYTADLIHGVTTAPAPDTPPNLNLTIQSPILTHNLISIPFTSIPKSHTLLLVQQTPENKTTLLLLLTPTLIIIQKEEETRLFGPDKPAIP